MLPCRRQSSVISSAGARPDVISRSFFGVAAPTGLARIQERPEVLVREPSEARELERVEVDNTAVVLVLYTQPRSVPPEVDLDGHRRELARELEAIGALHWSSVYCRQCRSRLASVSACRSRPPGRCSRTSSASPRRCPA